MKLSSLLVVGALVFGGLYVVRNVDKWRQHLHQEKAHVVATLKQKVHSEEARIRLALKERASKEQARAAAALKKQLARQRSQLARQRTRTSAIKGAATERAAKAVPAALTETAFWRLMSNTRSAAGNDTGRQSALLKDQLTRLSPQAIVEFAQIRHRLDERAYTWNLWGAAMVIEDGCSDDCFRDFRGYLISLGPDAYKKALANPDSLASVVQDAETGNWENADNVAPDAYSSVTGGDFPVDDSDLSGPPRGTPIDDNDPAALARRYPNLAARFR
jgi:Protein of unknown function (DUF4240)